MLIPFILITLAILAVGVTLVTLCSDDSSETFLDGNVGVNYFFTVIVVLLIALLVGVTKLDPSLTRIYVPYDVIQTNAYTIVFIEDEVVMSILTSDWVLDIDNIVVKQELSIFHIARPKQVADKRKMSENLEDIE